MIYVVNGIYFVPDQNTLDIATTNELDGNFVIGTYDDANTECNNVCQQILNQTADWFTTNKITIDNEGHETWEVIDLNQEPDNNDVTYGIFKVVVAEYTKVIGLENAKTTLSEMKNNYLTWAGHNSIITLESLDSEIERKKSENLK